MAARRSRQRGKGRSAAWGNAAHGGSRAAQKGKAAARGEARPMGGGAQRGKRLHPIRRYVLLWSQGGVSNVLPYRPPFIFAPISGDDSPQTRELNVEDRVGFCAERAKDFCGGEVRCDILRQDRDKRGLGIGDARKGAVLGGIRAGRACGRAAARHGDRGGATLPNRLANRIRRAAGPPAALRWPPPDSNPPEPPSASGGS